MSPTKLPPAENDYEKTFGCPVAFRQSANCLQFDAAWLDRTPPLGNEIAYSTVIALCDDLHDRLRNRLGLAGKVRSLLLANLGPSREPGGRQRPPGYSRSGR